MLAITERLRRILLITALVRLEHLFNLYYVSKRHTHNSCASFGTFYGAFYVILHCMFNPLYIINTVIVVTETKMILKHGSFDARCLSPHEIPLWDHFCSHILLWKRDFKKNIFALSSSTTLECWFFLNLIMPSCHVVTIIGIDHIMHVYVL